ncbi:leucyl aminopeptidase [Roseiarcus fermentans]|uniref:Probable cytosol aminopeptidase n=1 Tax=Roseiarcus fermentans TaxID=1473586 RepID=A0A366FTQ4_9HYPH|nr:leucyl aminopeptidase [Roseiarcus fermentans]RBP17125.1 leucyl aminopeptidase [Roseiarcus fermentans]
MSAAVKISFGPLAAPKGGALVVFVGADMKPSAAVAAQAGDLEPLIRAAAKAVSFKGAQRTALDILAPAGVEAARLIVVGVAPAKDNAALDFVMLGGFVFGKASGATRVEVAFDGPAGAWDAAAEADFALGLRLRGYKFDKYKTRKKEPDEDDAGPPEFVLGSGHAAAARAAAHDRFAVADGVELARNLVNEPPNVLFPTEFADRAKALEKLGVEVGVLDEKEMARLGMHALLGVGRGSSRDSRLVTLRWNGARAKRGKPVAVIGKGVCFDSGGISIKPAAGMEDMKGDMGGAACVVGLMHALAARKAKVNVVGVVGLVENMPDGDAIRPGDILTSMSGQTIEIINTDAEGRLVLSDALFYTEQTFKPRVMIDLATLTGAIMVALGAEYAGLFANNDELAQAIAAAGEATGEKVWRMPLAKAYDKLIDSKIADMKNTGGRHGGSITAAQFLQRFVKDTPWAHIDVAGVAMGSPSSDINSSWGSGWGVRLLNRLIADAYED